MTAPEALSVLLKGEPIQLGPMIYRWANGRLERAQARLREDVKSWMKDSIGTPIPLKKGDWVGTGLHWVESRLTVTEFLGGRFG